MLLNALVAIGLLAKRGDTFENTPVSSRYLMAGGKDDNRAALMHTAHLWLTWSNLTASVRAGTAVGQGDRGDNWTEAFIAAMHRNASERAGAVVREAGAEKARRVLDIGGGSGAYSIAFAKANPEIQAEVLDLPAVTKIAERHIGAAGVQDRVRTRIGDLRTDHFGHGYDLLFVSAICHMLSPDENADLAKRCFEALALGGRVVIQDFVLDATKTAPKMAAMFALNMLVGTRAGSSYSEPEYVQWLRGAGFSGVQCVRMPGPTALMIGTKP